LIGLVDLVQISQYKVVF